MPGTTTPPHADGPLGSLAVRTIPSSDVAFDAHVRSAVRGLAHRDPRLLQERIRAAYPLALVRPRDLDGEPEPTWYVYRDGHWVPPQPVRRDPGTEERAT